MNSPELFNTMFDSLYWARDRVLDVADGMSDEEFGRDNGFSHNSIRGILVHTLFAEALYVSRIAGQPMPAADSPEAISETTCASVESVRARWQAQEAATRAVLAGVTAESLNEDVVFMRRDGVEVRQPLWQQLLSLYQHTLQHRSEAAEALTLVGRSPGGLDFGVYLAAKNEA